MTSIVIAGAGIGGLTASLCLARLGLDVTVIEQSEKISEIGAGIQISPNGNRVLSALGLSDELENVAFRPEMSQRRDWKTGLPSWLLRSKRGYGTRRDVRHA